MVNIVDEKNVINSSRMNNKELIKGWHCTGIEKEIKFFIYLRNFETALIKQRVKRAFAICPKILRLLF